MDDLIVQDNSHERTLFLVMSVFYLYLKPGDFDEYSRTLRMADFFEDDDGCMWLKLGVSDRGLQTVRVPEPYIRHLERYRHYLGTHLTPLSRDHSPVFSAHFGRPGLSRAHVNLLFQNVLAHAAVAMERDGCSAEDIQNLRSGSLKWVRHTSANVSARRLSLSELHADLRNVNLNVTQGRYYGDVDQRRGIYSGLRNSCTCSVSTDTLNLSTTEVPLMSRLAEYRQLEQKLAAQIAELEALKNDEGLKKEIEFESKLTTISAFAT